MNRGLFAAVVATIAATAAAMFGALLSPVLAAVPVLASAPPACTGTIYLTFDTGSQSQASLIADTLRRLGVKATFFMANEKTTRGDYSLDPSWAPYWKALVADGHAFGSHTFDHVYLQRDARSGAVSGTNAGTAGATIAVKAQFGKDAGKKMDWSLDQYCAEIRRVDTRFQQLTGTRLDPIWRAPGGRVSDQSIAAGETCGYHHVGWAKAGFSGDELSSSAVSNSVLLKRSLDNLKDGDIFVAHLGIWSRQDPWAPANLEPLIVGLQKKGYCFATLRAHPDYAGLKRR
jgi:peptidoglycan/xylan/chitin deacetylase (PgdA/CDA1 family)